MLCVLDTGIQTALENMNRDIALLQELDSDPVLHLYDWDGLSATYGHFIQTEKHLDLRAVERKKVSLARRPTGGGIVFHIWDYAFSFLMPSQHPLFSQNPLDNYRFVNQVVVDVVQDFFSLKESLDLIEHSYPVSGLDCQNFCMARPTIYDVVYKGYKIAGAAQRKTKKGYLHQGTISLGNPDIDFLSEVLLSKEDVAQAMNTYSFAPLGKNPSSAVLQSTRAEIGKLLVKAFHEKLKT